MSPPYCLDVHLHSDNGYSPRPFIILPKCDGNSQIDSESPKRSVSLSFTTSWLLGLHVQTKDISLEFLRQSLAYD